ncbi:hypothetical protein VV01_21285 [Luteipulveratus halotolerans]|uniref:Uncharacterized protein n=1 Tax=Luteipulveratus halotolerans TaxID=1631356 RepID=A0A0L6CEA0_9MICO|nr:hypothetical protein VV01_21285 [Luteipulveratus halotolerans]
MASRNISSMGTHAAAEMIHTATLAVPASAYTAEGRLRIPDPAIDPKARGTAEIRVSCPVRVGGM